MEDMRGPEQRESTPSQTPQEVLLQMRENYAQGEKMDIPSLLSSVQLLDRMGVTGNKVISERILQPLGKDPRLESAVADGYREASLQGEQAALTKYTRLAEVLGIDQALLTTAPVQPVKEEPTPVKEPELREVGIGVEDLLLVKGPALHPSTSPFTPAVRDYLEKALAGLTPEQLSSYLQRNPLITLRMDLASFQLNQQEVIRETRQALRAEEISRYLEENPLNLLTLDHIYTSCSKDAPVVRAVATRLNSDQLRVELEKNPVILLELNRTCLAHPDISPFSLEQQEVIEAACYRLGPEQVKPLIDKDPLILLRAGGASSWFSWDVRRLLSEEAEKVRFKLRIPTVEEPEREEIPESPVSKQPQKIVLTPEARAQLEPLFNELREAYRQFLARPSSWNWEIVTARESELDSILRLPEDESAQTIQKEKERRQILTRSAQNIGHLLSIVRHYSLYLSLPKEPYSVQFFQSELLLFQRLFAKAPPDLRETFEKYTSHHTRKPKFEEVESIEKWRQTVEEDQKAFEDLLDREIRSVAPTETELDREQTLGRIADHAASTFIQALEADPKLPVDQLRQALILKNRSRIRHLQVFDTLKEREVSWFNNLAKLAGLKIVEDKGGLRLEPVEGTKDERA